VSNRRKSAALAKKTAEDNNRRAQKERRLRAAAEAAERRKFDAAEKDSNRKLLDGLMKLARRSWASLNRDERAESAYWSQQARTLIGNLKAAPCADCGHSFLACAMDFDHVRGVKLFTISSMLSAGVWWRGRFELLQSELTKCEVVCAVCHRIRTHNRKQYTRREPGIL